MGETGQATATETFEELVDKTRGPREMIVTGLRFYGGQANARQLRRYGKIPSRNYHFKKLEEQGVIEQEGDEDISQGGAAAKIYRLTDLGQEVAEALEESSGRTSTVTEIEERLDDVEEKLQKMDGLLVDIAVHTGILDENDAEEYREKQGISQSK